LLSNDDLWILDLQNCGVFASYSCYSRVLRFVPAVLRNNRPGKAAGVRRSRSLCDRHSLATRGHLAIDELQWLQDRVNIGAAGPNHHLYTKYFPGSVFSIALVYKLTARPNDQPYIWVTEMAPSVTGARWVLRLNALWGALGMTSLILCLRRLFPWRTAVLTVILVGCCSDWWYQSRGLYSEVAAGALLITTLCFAIYQRPYGSSVALAFSILFRPTNVLGLPFWGKAVWPRKKALLSGFIIIAAGVFLATYNWMRFGSPLDFGYPKGNLSVPLLTGLQVLFLSPGRSLFVYSPILVLAIPGAWLFCKKERILAILCLFVVVAYALIVACWGPLGWGLSWGMRLMTPTLPLLAVMAASVIDYLWVKKWVALVSSLLALIGFSIQILALLRDPTHVLIDRVQSGEVQFEDTIYSTRNCWLALQIRAMPKWQRCDLDSYTLRHLFTSCGD
jgi:hypothetical protein